MNKRHPPQPPPSREEVAQQALACLLPPCFLPASQNPVRPEKAVLRPVPVSLMAALAQNPAMGGHFRTRPRQTVIGRVERPKNPIRPEEPRRLLKNGNPSGNPQSAPRCGAKTRLGCPCKGPAMKNGRCRMHGGTSTGPKTAAGKARIAAARTKHGSYTPQARQFRDHCAQLLASSKHLLLLARQHIAHPTGQTPINPIRPENAPLAQPPPLRRSSAPPPSG